MEQSASTPLPEREQAPPPPPAETPGARFRPLSGRARATVVAFYGLIATALFTIGADIYGLVAIDKGIAGDADADAMLRTSDTLDATSGILFGLTFLVLAILFLRWFYRAYKNLPALGIEPNRSAGWAVGSWFIPFVAFVVPVWSAVDIWRSGDTDAPRSQPWYDRPIGWLVPAWWTAWIVSSILGNIVARAWWNAATDLEDYRRAYAVDLVSMGVDIVAALLAIAFVRRATRRQEAMAERIAEEGPHEPAPEPPAEFTVEPAWKPSDQL